jgi:hypothetical protein
MPGGTGALASTLALVAARSGGALALALDEAVGLAVVDAVGLGGGSREHAPSKATDGATSSMRRSTSDR